ncbi:MAG TPA: hypothetical protein VMT82_03985 [candidate division Zixibacteria bacterium]|nr:hypothetical protein [candidate division Zixibacteria bacterium]
MSGFEDPLERLRLERLYRAMSDGELEKLASTAYELSDDAFEALEEEVEQRGLSVAMVDAPPMADAVEKLELVEVARFVDLSSALPAKNALEAAGVSCTFRDDNMIRLDWFISNLIGGIKLMVPKHQLQAAVDVLHAPTQDSFEAGEFGEYHLPRCPKCNSLEIVFESLNKPVALTTAWLLAPLPLPRNEWKCNDCGHHWSESSEKPDAQVEEH